MIDPEHISLLLSQRYFAEAAYFGTVSALQRPAALAHMLAGVACCGCAEPLAIAQKVLEGAPGPDDAGLGGLRVSPATVLPYEGFFHLLHALRLDRSIKAPVNLRELFDAVADDLAYASRRELHGSTDKPRRYSVRAASVAAAVLLRRLTGSDRELPGVAAPTLEIATEIIDTELGRTDGDAAFFNTTSIGAHA